MNTRESDIVLIIAGASLVVLILVDLFLRS